MAANTTNADVATRAGEREIIATRVFAAPRALVFTLWTDPHHVEQWWGPNGFTTTIHEMDVRPGGVWRFPLLSPVPPIAPVYTILGFSEIRNRAGDVQDASDLVIDSR